MSEVGTEDLICVCGKLGVCGCAVRVFVCVWEGLYSWDNVGFTCAFVICVFGTGVV